MPAWMPEGNIVKPTDSEMRAAAKWCQILYDAFGEQSSTFPEGVAPHPGDDLQRLYRKIKILEGNQTSPGIQ
jgi:hypothetical protein